MAKNNILHRCKEIIIPWTSIPWNAPWEIDSLMLDVAVQPRVWFTKALVLVQETTNLSIREQ